MILEVNKIYRVVSTDQYQSTNAETYWTTDKKSCEDYIANSYYKHCLHIETSTLTNKAFKCV